MKQRNEDWQRVNDPRVVLGVVSGGPSAAKESPLMSNWQRYLKNSPVLFTVCETTTSIMSIDNVRCFSLKYDPSCVVGWSCFRYQLQLQA